jgi:hypothetical protein
MMFGGECGSWRQENGLGLGLEHQRSPFVSPDARLPLIYALLGSSYESELQMRGQGRCCLVASVRVL